MITKAIVLVPTFEVHVNDISWMEQDVISDVRVLIVRIRVDHRAQIIHVNMSSRFSDCGEVMIVFFDM
jgi:hypothetical protein